MSIAPDGFVCTLCDKEFDTQTGLKMHIGKKHKKTAKLNQIRMMTW